MDDKKMGDLLRRLRKSVVNNGNDFAREGHLSSKSVIRIEKGSRCNPSRG